ncbi:MAG: hypothetical protein AB7N76_11990 [Planctomycetota bacterium]
MREERSASACPEPEKSAPEKPAGPELPAAPPGSLNGWVLRTLQGYPLNGACGYHWPAPGSDPWEGTTVSLVYDGVQLTHGDPQRRSYCCGLTFEVYVRALLAANGGAPVPGLAASELHELRLRFFGDSKTKERRRLVQAGIESLGLGRRVELEDARAGDFVQFWRHRGSGHSAIFINWARRKGAIVGLTYWSSQSSTDGIGYHTEPVGPEGIDAKEIYLARADWPLAAARRAQKR